MKIVTVVLKRNGCGSSVLLDDEPLEGVVAVKVSQVVGEMAKVVIELAAPIVVVKAETDDVTIATAEKETEKDETVR